MLHLAFLIKAKTSKTIGVKLDMASMLHLPFLGLDVLKSLVLFF